MDEHFGAYVRWAQGGQVTAFGWLVWRFHDRAVGYARALLTDPTAAEDAAGAGRFPVFLRRIVFKQCDRIRRVLGKE